MNPELLQLLFKAQAAAENLIRAARDVKSHKGQLLSFVDDDTDASSIEGDFDNLAKTIDDAELALMEVSGAVLSGAVIAPTTPVEWPVAAPVSTPVSQGTNAETEYVGEYQGEGDCQITVFTPHY